MSTFLDRIIPRRISPCPEYRRQLRDSFHAKLNWWMQHFLDRPFCEWPEYILVARHVSVQEFAEYAIARGVRVSEVRLGCGIYDPSSYIAEVKLLLAEIKLWLRHRKDPSVWLLSWICRCWSVPLDGWLLNPSVPTCSIHATQRRVPH